MMGYYRDFCPRRGRVGAKNRCFASICYRRVAPDLGALIEERSEIRGGAITLATGVDKKFWAMGHVFATGFRPNYFTDRVLSIRNVIINSYDAFDFMRRRLR